MDASAKRRRIPRLLADRAGLVDRAGALAALLAFLLLCAPVGGFAAASYPIEDIRLILAVSEGSQPALLYTALQRAASRHSRVPCTLEYRPGRGGSYAWNLLQEQPATGYALAAAHYPSFPLLAADRERVFDPAKLAPVALFAYAANALWVASDSPFRTPEDLALYARTPGNTLILAGTGSFTDHHMATLVFNRATGVKALYMPMNGTEESINAVTDKRATACWGYALNESTMKGMRPLALAAKERSFVLPDLPTFRELKLDIISGQHFGLFMPASDRNDIQDAVAEFFLTLFSDQEFLGELGRLGFTPTLLSPKEMPVFAGKQERDVQLFLDEYSAIYPRGRKR